MLPFDDDALLLLHNPRCSKSREAAALLDARGARYETRLYLEAPLSRGELADLAQRLARPVRELVRTKEPAFAALGLIASAGDDALLDALAREPALLERPVLVRGKRAVIGRPPEAVLELLA
ncbi:MAG: arsenate reductase (glutaredoxin) [Deltaproteobacteria bacterium]|nr:arsenate reductase (glutaredoxin) [Deltaproteobacteria bacterium]